MSEGLVGRRSLRRLPAVVTTLILIAAACSAATQDPVLRVAPGCDGCSAVVAQSHAALNEPASFGGIILCLENPGSVTVTSVALVGVEGGLRLANFGLRPNPFVRGQPGVGAEPAPLSDLGFDLAAEPVIDTTCLTSAGELDASRGGSELAVEVSNPGSQVARSASLEVTYLDAASVSHKLPIAYGLILCPGDCPDLESGSAVP